MLRHFNGFTIVAMALAMQGCNGAVPGYFKNLPSSPAPSATSSLSSTSPTPTASLSASPLPTPSTGPSASPTANPSPSPSPNAFIVQGTVIDSASRVAIANANVSFTAMGVLNLVTTDNTGTFIALKLKAGSYNLAVNAIGYQLYQSNITVNANTTLPVITLSH